MKKAFISITKILLIICLSVCLILPVQSTYSYAEGLTPENYGEPGDTTGADYDTTFINNYATKLSSLLYGIAVIIAVICIMFVGVKYITSGVNGKADYKKDLIPMAIGVAVVTFLGAILSVIAKLGEDI